MTIVLPTSGIEVDVVSLTTLELKSITLEASILHIVVAEIQTLGEVTAFAEVKQTCARSVGVGSNALLAVEEYTISLRNTAIDCCCKIVGQNLSRHIIGLPCPH